MPENEGQEKGFDFESANDDEIIDRFHEDPKGFVDLIATQVRKGIEAENEQKAEEGRFIKTYQDFQKQYPDFGEMWDSGKIKEHMAEHPGHNALSSYLALTDKTRIEQAVQSKLAEKGLGGDGSLADTKKHGGSTRMLADRLRALRSQGAGKPPPAGNTESVDLKPTM